MNTQQRAAMTMALEVLECLYDNGVEGTPVYKHDNAITALREALAQPCKEHDLTDVRCECCGYMTYHREHMGCIRAAQPQDLIKYREGYEQGKFDAQMEVQPQGEWVDLTDDEFVDAVMTYHGSGLSSVTSQQLRIAREVIAKFKSKNTPPVVQQEPVAWALMHKNGLEFNSGYGMRETLQAAEDMQRRHLGNLQIVPLYTTPPTAALAARQMRDACVSILHNLDMGPAYQLSLGQRMRLREAMEALPILGEEK